MANLDGIKPGDKVHVEFDGFFVAHGDAVSAWDTEIILPEILGVSVFVRHEHVTVIKDD